MYVLVLLVFGSVSEYLGRLPLITSALVQYGPVPTHLIWLVLLAVFAPASPPCWQWPNPSPGVVGFEFVEHGVADAGEVHRQPRQARGRDPRFGHGLTGAAAAVGALRRPAFFQGKPEVFGAGG